MPVGVLPVLALSKLMLSTQSWSDRHGFVECTTPRVEIAAQYHSTRPIVRANRMFKHLDSLQTDQVKDTMFLVEHEPDDVVIREGTLQDVFDMLYEFGARAKV